MAKANPTEETKPDNTSDRIQRRRYGMKIPRAEKRKILSDYDKLSPKDQEVFKGLIEHVKEDDLPGSIASAFVSAREAGHPAFERIVDALLEAQERTRVKGAGS